MMLNQVDKVILSKMVSLESFGYYNLASVAAGSIYRLVGPVFSALFPRFSALVSLNDVKRLTQIYHKGCQLVSVLILPATVVGAVFSGPILLVWTRNATTSLSTHAIMSLLLIGSALNALIYLPYALQLAYGWTTLGIYLNVFGLVAAAALLPLLISHHGAVGAAAAKLIISGAVFAIGPCIMHRRVLVGEMWRWFVDDVGKPLAATSVCVAIAACFRIEAWTPGLTLAFLLGVFVLASDASALVGKDARASVLSLFEHRFGWVRKAAGPRPVRPL
jgi:O-antigen/teichoic acid export membrane protein